MFFPRRICRPLRGMGLEVRGGGGADSGISSASVSVFDDNVSSGGVGRDFAFFFLFLSFLGVSAADASLDVVVCNSAGLSASLRRRLSSFRCLFSALSRFLRAFAAASSSSSSGTSSAPFFLPLALAIASASFRIALNSRCCSETSSFALKSSLCTNKPPDTNTIPPHFPCANIANFLSSTFRSTASTSSSLFPFNLPNNPWNASNPVRLASTSLLFNDAPNPRLSSLKETFSFALS